MTDIPIVVIDDAQIKEIQGSTGESERIADYFKACGLNVPPPENLRFAELEYFHEGKNVGRFGAIVAPLKQGKVLTGLFVTYLEGNRKLSTYPAEKVFSCSDNNLGAAIQLYKAGKTLAIAVGIENACAVHEIKKKPAWALSSKENIRNFVPPPVVERLFVYVDTCAGFADYQAAVVLKGMLGLRGINVYIKRAPKGNTWLDELGRNV